MMAPRDQFFTDFALAERIAEWALKPFFSGFLPELTQPRDMSILEPSAGDGAFVLGLAKCGIRSSQIVAIESDESLKEPFAKNCGRTFDCFDFLKAEFPWKFDLCLMNSPYRKRQDETHLLHALKCSKRVVTLCLSSIDYSARRNESIWPHARIVRRVKLKDRPPFHGPDCKGETAQYNYQVLDIVPCERKPGQIDMVSEETW